MARPQSNINTIKRSITAELKALKVYRPEYDRVIDVYADLIVAYIEQSKKLNDGAYAMRTPLLLSVENLRKDILSYSNQLGLTPAGLKKIQGDQKPAKQSSLAIALKQAHG